MTMRTLALLGTAMAAMMVPRGIWAQVTDEPGMSDPVQPGQPPPVPPAPATQPASAPLVSPSAGAPGAQGGASAPAPAAPALALAAAECRPATPCVHFPELVRLLFTPDHGGAAAAELGRLGLSRAVVPLAQAAIYGPVAGRAAALAALRQAMTQSAAATVARRVAHDDADPAVRAIMTRALGGETSLRRGADGEEPATSGKADKPATAKGLTDPDTTRVVYGPTAFGRPKGDFNWTIYNIGFWSFDYGVTDHLEIGIQTVPPIGVVALLPQVKLTTRVSEKVALGLRLFGGLLYPYIENDTSWRAGVYGGSPVLTIGSPDLLLNLSVMVTGVTVGSEDWVDRNWGMFVDSERQLRHESTWNVTPSVGFSWRLAKRVKLNAELHAPVSGETDSLNGKLWILLYGVRIFGERIYGDVNFVVPFWDEMGEVMQYAPIGFPLLTFGFIA